MAHPTLLNQLVASLVIVGFTTLWIVLGCFVHRLSFGVWNHQAR